MRSQSEWNVDDVVQTLLSTNPNILIYASVVLMDKKNFEETKKLSKSVNCKHNLLVNSKYFYDILLLGHTYDQLGSHKTHSNIEHIVFFAFKMYFVWFSLFEVGKRDLIPSQILEIEIQTTFRSNYIGATAIKDYATTSSSFRVRNFFFGLLLWCSNSFTVFFANKNNWWNPMNEA